MTAPTLLRAPDVVVGLGNEIAGDDGAGIEVARILGRRLAENPEIDVIALPWAGFALLDVLRGRRRAAIVDCLATGNHPPGAVVPIEESDLAGSVRLNSFHDISYPTALDLGRSLGWQIPETIAIWGIEAQSSDTFTEELSPPVTAAIRQVADEVAAFLETPLDRQNRPIPHEGGMNTSPADPTPQPLSPAFLETPLGRQNRPIPHEGGMKGSSTDPTRSSPFRGAKRRVTEPDL